MKRIGQVIGLLVAVLLGLFLLSNVNKGFVLKEPDQLHVELRPSVEWSQVLARHEGSRVLDTVQGLVKVPYGTASQEVKSWNQDPGVQIAMQIETSPHFSFKSMLYGLQQQLAQYAKGEFGGLSYNSSLEREYPVSTYLWDLCKRSLGYLIPGLLLGLLIGFGFALLGTWKPRVGRALDAVHSFLLGIPDFFLVVLLQFAAIGLVKLVGHKVFLIMQFASDIPFAIPMLSISILPGVLLYGVLRIALEREWAQTYVSTAYSKGLSRAKVLLVHILRNTAPDLIALLPRLIATAITSLVVVEVMCGIFGLGGYAINKDLFRVTSLTTTCAILALFVLLTRLASFLWHRKAVLRFEGGAISGKRRTYTRRDARLYGLSWIFLLLLAFIAVAGEWILPHGFANGESIPWIMRSIGGVAKYDMPPFAPSDAYWLGSDHRGYDVLSLLLNGARYTLGFALLVTLARFLIALPLGLWSGMTGRLRGLVTWMQITTASVPTLLFLFPIVYGLYQAGIGGQPLSDPNGRLFAEVLFALFVFFGVFQIAEQFATRAQFYRDALYMDAGRMMGASTGRLLRVHLAPQLRAELFYSFVVEIVQVLFLIGQLAVLGFFLGGGMLFSFGDGSSIPLTTTGEWGGMIAYGIRTVRAYPWIIISSGLAMTLSIFCLLFFSQQLQKRLDPPRVASDMQRSFILRPRLWGTVGGTALICGALVFLLRLPGETPPTLNALLATSQPALNQNLAQQKAEQDEKTRQECRKVAENFMKYIVEGNWEYASVYVDYNAPKQPTKPFDAWITGFTEKGFQFVGIGQVSNLTYDSNNPYVGAPVEIQVLDGQGKADTWMLYVDTRSVYGAMGEPK